MDPYQSKAQNPSTANADVSNPDATGIFKNQVDYLVDNSQVAFYTGQDMKKSLSIVSN